MNDDSWIFWLFLAFVILWFGWLDESEFRFRMQYDAEATVREKPHDCEFWAAPVGKKYCSYKPAPKFVIYSTDVEKGDPIVSYDEGKTWAWNPGGPTEHKKTVIIGWEQVRE